MAQFDDLTAVPEDFAGKARLFPLPDLVMFPHVMQPLHIFEPRYLEMLRDTLASDQLIAMAVLEPGWEVDYMGRPPVCPFACLGKVVTHVPAEGGGQNILLLGLQRVVIEAEFPPQRNYREAQVELVSDDYPSSDSDESLELQRQVFDAFQQFVPQSMLASGQFRQLLIGSDVPLGVLTDIVAFTVDLPLAAKRVLLSQPDVVRRARRLLLELRELFGAEPGQPFPPPFSDN